MLSWKPAVGLSHQSRPVCSGAARETGTLCFLEPFIVASGLRLEGPRPLFTLPGLTYMCGSSQLGGLWPPVILLQVALCSSGNCLREVRICPPTVGQGAARAGGWGWRGTAGPLGRLGSASFPPPCSPPVCSPQLGLLGTAVGKVIPQGMVLGYSVFGGRPETPLSPRQGCSVRGRRSAVAGAAWAGRCMARAPRSRRLLPSEQRQL